MKAIVKTKCLHIISNEEIRMDDSCISKATISISSCEINSVYLGRKVSVYHGYQFLGFFTSFSLYPCFPLPHPKCTWAAHSHLTLFFDPPIIAEKGKGPLKRQGLLPAPLKEFNIFALLSFSNQSPALLSPKTK